MLEKETTAMRIGKMILPHGSNEFYFGDLLIVIDIYDRHEFLDFKNAQTEIELFHANYEFLLGNRSVTILIKEIKCFRQGHVIVE